MMSERVRLLHVVRDAAVVGEIEHLRSGRMRLRYWPVAQAVGPLSVSLPLLRIRHQDGAIRPWIEGLFPDRPDLLRAWRRRFSLTTGDPFDLLAMVGEDVAGAAQFVRPERVESVLSTPGSLQPLTDDQVADLVLASLADLPIIDDATGTGRFSLAGAQAKVALRHTGTGWALPTGAAASTHILKPSIPGLPDQDVVEALTMRTARAIGLSVASVDLIEVGGIRTLVTERFDRLVTPAGVARVHQEDVCQAMGLDPRRKYEAEGGPGVGAVAALISSVSSRRPEDLSRFVQAIVFNTLVGGTDAHSRNYALLLDEANVRFAPLYDLNTWAAFGPLETAELAMSVGGERRVGSIRPRHWREFAAVSGVDPEWVLDEVARQRSAIPAALERERDRLGPVATHSGTVGRAVDQIGEHMTR